MKTHEKVLVATLCVFGIAIGYFLPKVKSLAFSKLTANDVLITIGIAGLIALGIDYFSHLKNDGGNKND